MVTLETEAMFAEWVNDARRLGGWRATHFRPGRGERGWSTPLEGDAGWPDWTFVHTDGRLVIAELKSQNGTVTADQRWWLDMLANAAMCVGADLGSSVLAFDVCLWRPSDRPEIEDVLLRGARASSTRWKITRSLRIREPLPTMEADGAPFT